MDRIGSLGSVLQSDNGPSFNSEVFQDVVKREFGLKHVFSKTNSSASQGRVERDQLALQSMVYKRKSASSCSAWHNVLQRLVHSYNVKKQSD